MDFQSPDSQALLLALERSGPEIIRRWEREVRARVYNAQELSGPLLRDHLPVFLKGIAELIRGEGTRPLGKDGPGRLGTVHGIQRSRDTNFSLQDVLKEYRIFRSVVLQVLEEQFRFPLEQRLFLHEQIDQAMEAAVSSFTVDAAGVRDSFFNLPGLLFCVATTEGYFKRLNPAWEDVLGYSQAELVALPFISFVHPVDVAATQRQVVRLLAGERAVGFVNRYRHRNGSYRWLHWTVERMGDEYYGLALDITGVKETEGQLQRSWDRFDRVSKATGLGVWYCDLPFDVLEWNEEVKEHFWLQPNERVTIQLFYERIHPEDRELTRRAIEESNRTGERYDIVYRTTNPANPEQVKWIRAVGWTAYGDAGTPVSFDGFTLDVTETRRVENALEESQATIQRSEQQLKLITDRLPAFVAYVDKDQRYTFVNQTYETWFGKTPDAILGRPAWEVMGAEVYERAKVYVEIALSGRAAAYENTLRQASGREIHVHAEYLPDFHPRTGEVRGYVVVAHDITNRKQAQDALEASAKRFQSLTEAVPQIVWTADPTGHVDWYSQQWYDYTGLAPGQEWPTVMHPDDLAPTNARWMHSVRTGEPYECEYRFRRVDGEYRWFLGRAVPVRDKNGQIAQWLGTNTDIHDKYEAAQQLKEAVRARDEFLSIASHELKTPLTSLKLQTQMFQRMVEKGLPQAYSPERVNGLMVQTNRQVTRLTRLVDDMLDISRIRTGKLSIEKQPMDFCALVHEAVERMRPHFRDAGAPDPILDCAGSAVINLDPVRIEQVVNNLLTNALRYGRLRPVTVRVSVGPERIHFSVADQGLGIAPENHAKIFDRFERAVSANEVSGLGLGLFITRQIVEAHGGRIWVESRLGEGATFHVELPRPVPGGPSGGAP